MNKPVSTWLVNRVRRAKAIPKPHRFTNYYGESVPGSALLPFEIWFAG
jgi:hypothetical protein